VIGQEIPPEPTGEQCNKCARVDFNGRRAFATWYPQMGGYCSKSVIVEDGQCFGAFVWHDGQFPFSDDGHACDDCGSRRSPAYIHHCDASQFVNFGQRVDRELSLWQHQDVLRVLRLAADCIGDESLVREIRTVIHGLES